MRPARHDPLLAGLNPAAAAFEFAVVWLTLAGFALSDPEVTVSVGVATHRGGGTTPEKLVAIADRAAYRAKFSGRNSVAVPPEGDPVDEAERVLFDASHQR